MSSRWPVALLVGGMDFEANPLVEVARYEKVQTLGKGSFGFVQLALNQQQELAAIKVSCCACFCLLLLQGC